MKRILLPILVIGILLFSACGAPTASVFTGGPRISFDQDFVYLGEATPQQRIHYEFSFKNVGNAPLVVYDTSIKTLKGCCPPKPVVSSTTLQPGEESNILIDFIMGREMEDKHLFEITVKSNDPVEPEKKIFLEIDYIFEA